MSCISLNNSEASNIYSILTYLKSYQILKINYIKMSNKKTWYKKAAVPKVNIQNKEVYHYDISPRHGYNGFKLYFHNEETIEIGVIVDKVKAFEKYISQHSDQFPTKKIREDKFFIVDLHSLKSNDSFLTSWPDFAEEIITKSEECLHCMGLAMHQTLVNEIKEVYRNENNIEAHINELPKIYARPVNHEPILHLKDLDVKNFGKLVTIRGTVIKAESTKLICNYMTFSCSYCGGSQNIEQIEGNFTPPESCLSKGCNAHTNFIPLFSSPHTNTINIQTIKLQELVGGDEPFESGRIPRTVECDMIEDLVNCCIPGDDVILTGVVKARNSTENCKNKQSALFLLYLNVVSIVNEKKKDSSSGSRITFTVKDYYAIRAIHAEVMVFRLLVQSLCPAIFGHEVIKAGLILALFGGTENDDNVRAQSHVLIVGDPGLGKSQMLQACSNVAPRGIYVCGNTSTGCGLTVTLTKDTGGEYELEAGALVLADQGCCCIDEFDKMPTQHACLLEAMEQQSISIAKAGITCSLPTRVTVLAAANPAGGHYNKAKTVSENLKIASPMLSRFDLVFILVDQPNEQHDKLLSEHITALHTGNRSKYMRSTQSTSSSTPQECTSLKEKLKIQPGASVDYLTHALLRKYIAYAKKYIHPKLSIEAKEVLQKFYLNLRKKYRNINCVPITTRQLQSLVRLTQARARLELRDEATAEDAIDVVEIMRYSLVDVFVDETGKLDFSRSQQGTGYSGRGLANRFLLLLQQKADMLRKSNFDSKELEELGEQIGLTGEKCHNLIETLNIQGYLLMKGPGRYKLTTT